MLLAACAIKHCCGTISIISLLLMVCAIQHCCGTLSILFHCCWRHVPYSIVVALSIFISLLLMACAIQHCCGTLSIFISLLLVACAMQHCCGTLSIFISLLLMACAMQHCCGTLSIFTLLTVRCTSTINRVYCYFLFVTKSMRTRQNVMLKVHSPSFSVCSKQWRTEGGFGGFNPPRNSDDIGGVLDRMSKKNRRLEFLVVHCVLIRL